MCPSVGIISCHFKVLARVVKLHVMFKFILLMHKLVVIVSVRINSLHLRVKYLQETDSLIAISHKQVNLVISGLLNHIYLCLVNEKLAILVLQMRCYMLSSYFLKMN